MDRIVIEKNFLLKPNTICADQHVQRRIVSRKCYTENNEINLNIRTDNQGTSVLNLFYARCNRA